MWSLRLSQQFAYFDQLAVGSETSEGGVRATILNVDTTRIKRFGSRHTRFTDVGFRAEYGRQEVGEFEPAASRTLRVQGLLGREVEPPRFGNSAWVGGSCGISRTDYAEEGAAEWRTRSCTLGYRLNVTSRPWSRSTDTRRIHRFDSAEGVCVAQDVDDAAVARKKAGSREERRQFRHNYRLCGGDAGRNYFYVYVREDDYEGSTPGRLRTVAPDRDRRFGISYTTSRPRSMNESEHIDGLFANVDPEDYLKTSFWAEHLRQVADSTLPLNIRGNRFFATVSLPLSKKERPRASIQSRVGVEDYDLSDGDLRRISIEAGARVHLKATRPARGLAKADFTVRARYLDTDLHTSTFDVDRGFFEAFVGLVFVWQDPDDSIPEEGGAEIEPLPGAGSAPPVTPPNVINGNG